MQKHKQPLDAHHDALGHHITPIHIYWLVFAALMTLTVVTVVVSVGPHALGLSLGSFALPVALVVAFGKATLVAVFFMHLKYDERFNSLILVSCLFFMGVFFAFTMMDVMSRDFANPEEAYFVMEHERQMLEAEAEAAAAPADEEEGAPADEADH